MEGGQGGRWGGAPEQCGSNKRCTGFNWSDLAGDKGGGMGGGVGRWHGGRARGDMGGTKGAPTTGRLVTRVGGWGEAWGGGPWRAGKGGDGGPPESSVGATKGALVAFLGCLKNLTTGLFWLVTRVGGWGRRGEVAHGGRARGGDGGGHQRAVWEPGLPLKPNNWSDLAGDEGGGMAGGVGRWPMEGGQGGEMGGGTREQCKRCTGSPFWALLQT